MSSLSTFPAGLYFFITVSPPIPNFIALGTFWPCVSFSLFEGHIIYPLSFIQCFLCFGISGYFYSWWLWRCWVFLFFSLAYDRVGLTVNLVKVMVVLPV